MPSGTIVDCAKPPVHVPHSPLNTQVDGSHYKDLKIQPIEYIHANNLPFIEGCIVKYITRWRVKGGFKDLDKIIHFVNLLKELEVKKSNTMIRKD